MMCELTTNDARRELPDTSTAVDGSNEMTQLTLGLEATRR